EAIGKHLTRLANPVRAVDRLGFHRWVPPGVEKINIFSRVQVEPQASGFETDEKQLQVWIVLELLDGHLAIARSAIEIGIRNVGVIEPAAHDGEKTRELRKNQDLMSLIDHLIELR